MATRVLPELNDENRDFWTGGANGRLQFLHCHQCDYHVHPPAPVCPKCFRTDTTPKEVSGFGEVVTFTLNYQQWVPDLDLPYAIAIVQLDEQPGLRLTSNIVNCDPEVVNIGMRVRVVFEQHEDVWLPLFEPDTAQ